MTSSDQRKPGEKSGKRKQKKAKKKAEQAEQRQAAPAASEPIEAAVAPEEAVETVAVVVEAAAAGEPIETAPAPEQEAIESTAAVEAVPAEPVERVASFRERMASVMPPPDIAPAKPVTTAPAETAQSVPSPAAAPATGIQAIANAYRDYTRKSLEDAQSFAEKLTAARSLDKAVEAQAEFARQACETFADNSRKIRELHRELFWQAFRLSGWPPGRTPR
jgi:phasin family protein